MQCYKLMLHGHDGVIFYWDISSFNVYNNNITPYFRLITPLMWYYFESKLQISLQEKAHNTVKKWVSLKVIELL